MFPSWRIYPPQKFMNLGYTLMDIQRVMPKELLIMQLNDWNR
jgi:hypothetical protein